MATKAGQARNEEIFQTAAKLMVLRGYAGTSMGDLAKAVGMTKAGLYHHISSKQDMLFQILLYAMEGLNEKVIEPTRDIADPEERLREMIGHHVRGLFEHGLEFALLFQERRHLETSQREIIWKEVDLYLGLIRKAMRELEQHGKLRELDPTITARHILQTITGIARWYSNDSGVTEDLLVEQTVNFNMAAILKR